LTDSPKLKLGWRELTPAAMITTPGSARDFLTGDWRTRRPILEESKCTKCLFCWLWCPEPAILRTEDGKISIDYNYCKGCGICATECPTKAISMVDEK